MVRLDDGAMRLREGCTPWLNSPPPRPIALVRLPAVIHTDIVIVGAGITGAFLAERLTRAGLGVVVIDRHAPAMGSTAASTAMLLWELDASLLELEGSFGAETTGLISRTCRRLVEQIGELVSQLGIDCEFAFQPSLYLAGDKLDAADLGEEHRLRRHLGISGSRLEGGDLAALGFQAGGALLYPGSARLDPIRLTRGLIAAAMQRGARVLSPADAMVYESLADGARVVTQEGDVLHARWLVLANGYEMPDFVPAARHKVLTTWAVATAPGLPAVTNPMPLVWEASDPYLYMRSTAAGRIIIGGADEPTSQANSDGRLGEKADLLLRAGAARWPLFEGQRAELAWSGVFGATHDSLPIIGSLPGRPHCFAAYGYGGNGITFSALAAEMLEARMRGQSHALADICAPDRA